MALGRNRIFINLHGLWGPKWFETKESKIGTGKMSPKRSHRGVPSGKMKFLQACYKVVFLIIFFFLQSWKGWKDLLEDKQVQNRALPCLQCSWAWEALQGKPEAEPQHLCPYPHHAEPSDYARQNPCWGSGELSQWCVSTPWMPSSRWNSSGGGTQQLGVSVPLLSWPLRELN